MTTRRQPKQKATTSRAAVEKAEGLLDNLQQIIMIPLLRDLERRKDKIMAKLRTDSIDPIYTWLDELEEGGLDYLADNTAADFKMPKTPKRAAPRRGARRAAPPPSSTRSTRSNARSTQSSTRSTRASSRAKKSDSTSPRRGNVVDEDMTPTVARPVIDAEATPNADVDPFVMASDDEETPVIRSTKRATKRTRTTAVHQTSPPSRARPSTLAMSRAPVVKSPTSSPTNKRATRGKKIVYNEPIDAEDTSAVEVVPNVRQTRSKVRRSPEVKIEIEEVEEEVTADRESFMARNRTSNVIKKSKKSTQPMPRVSIRAVEATMRAAAAAIETEAAPSTSRPIVLTTPVAVRQAATDDDDDEDMVPNSPMANVVVPLETVATPRRQPVKLLQRNATTGTKVGAPSRDFGKRVHTSPFNRAHGQRGTPVRAIVIKKMAASMSKMGGLAELHHPVDRIKAFLQRNTPEKHKTKMATDAVTEEKTTRKQMDAVRKKDHMLYERSEKVRREREVRAHKVDANKERLAKSPARLPRKEMSVTMATTTSKKPDVNKIDRLNNDRAQREKDRTTRKELARVERVREEERTAELQTTMDTARKNKAAEKQKAENKAKHMERVQKEEERREKEKARIAEEEREEHDRNVKQQRVEEETRRELRQEEEEMAKKAAKENEHVHKKPVAPTPIAKKVQQSRAESYDMTPLRVLEPSTAANYNIDDLDSGDETDEEDKPKKDIPFWAMSAQMKPALILQNHAVTESVLTQMFGVPLMPDLAAIFAGHRLRRRYVKRNDTGHWTSPVYKPHHHHP